MLDELFGPHTFVLLVLITVAPREACTVQEWLGVPIEGPDQSVGEHQAC
jgi:hypothetical protein